MSLVVPDYLMNQKNIIQGPGLAYYAPYVAAGADPATADIVPVGLFTEDGIEFGHKITFSHVKADQSTWPVDTFVTDQEMKIKLTLEEMSPSLMAIGMGLQTDALIPGPPAAIQFGEFFNIIAAGSLPSTRIEFRHWIMRIPSPGFDQGTTPKAGWAYLQLFKAAVTAHSAPKVGKKHQMTLQVEIEGFADTSVADAKGNVGKLTFAIPGV
jgi:hypothetical protein